MHGIQLYLSSSFSWPFQGGLVPKSLLLFYRFFLSTFSYHFRPRPEKCDVFARHNANVSFSASLTRLARPIQHDSHAPFNTTDVMSPNTKCDTIIMLWLLHHPAFSTLGSTDTSSCYHHPCESYSQHVMRCVGFTNEPSTLVSREYAQCGEHKLRNFKARYMEYAYMRAKSLPNLEWLFIGNVVSHMGLVGCVFSMYF